MTLQRAALWAIVIAATIYLLVAGRGLLLPFVLGLVLWYMVDSLADTFEQPRLGRLRLPRPLADVLAVLVRSAACSGSSAARSARNVHGRHRRRARATRARLTTAHRARRAQLVGVEQAPTLVELFDRISLADTLGSVATAAASVVSIAGIVLIYAGFLFVEQVHFKRKLAIIFHGDGAARPACCAVLDRIDREIRIYIRIKTTLAAATSALAYVVMASVGVDFAGFWAVMVFFFYYIPTVGSILAIVAPALLTLVQFDHLTPFLIVLFVFGTHPGRDGQRHRAGHHGPLAQPLAAGRDRLPDRVGHDLGRGRHVPLRAHHGGGADRARAVRDDAARRRAAVGRRRHPGATTP